MRWGDMRQSENVEDVTGGQPAGGGIPFGGGMKLGGGAMILVVIVSLLFGVNPLQFLGMMEGGGPAPAPPVPAARPQVAQPGYGPQTGKAPADPDKALASRVLGDTEDVWTALFQAMGSRYEPPKLVLFRKSIVSQCGRASSAAGPFYCPADRKLYLDTAFFQELQNRFGAPGDFAQAYVIAHEVGHHIQNLEGTLDKAQSAQASASTAGGNQIQVGVELQADCYAGVWAQRSGALEAGDIEEGMRAAEAIGDDMLTQGKVSPDNFTHGTSAQRTEALNRGLSTGNPSSCNYAK
jgi:predicted metalloprotease